MLRVLAAVLVIAAFAPSAGAAPQTGFAFGRLGGNIRPFTVVITTSGVVRTSGPVHVGRMKLSRLELGRLNTLAATSNFGSMPKTTTCSGTLPDVAGTFVRVGPKLVFVHGSCVPGYSRLWKALAQAVRLSD